MNKNTAIEPVKLWAPNPTTGERGTSTKLDSNQKDSIVYAAGRSIFIKNIDHLDSVSYTGHARPTTVAKFSPSGFYVASADVAGTVRVWDVAGDDQILKVEVKALSGRVNDLAWDADNGGKRIIAVGEGRERFGHAFAIDGGNSAGEISGHSKPINAVCIRSGRPFRAVTASDDTTLSFFHGPPYKYAKTVRTHAKFVQTVEYACDGSVFGSGGSDHKLFVYDGATGETVCQLGTDPAGARHSGTVFSIAWSKTHPALLASFSADGQVIQWDAASQKHLRSWKLASSPAPEHQLVGGTWLQGNRLVSLAYNGDLTVLDDRQPAPVKKIYACQKGIIGAAQCPRQSGLYAGDQAGRVFHYAADGVCKPVETPAGSPIIGLASGKSAVFSVAMDDMVREIDPAAAAYSPASCIPLPTQAKSIAARASDNVALVVTADQARLVDAGNCLATLPLEYSATACALSAEHAAIGAADGKVHIYDARAATLAPLGALAAGAAAVTCVALGGGRVAVGDQTGKIQLYDLAVPFAKLALWAGHTASIRALAWSPDTRFLASASLDTHIYVWAVEKPTRHLALKNAHAAGASAVFWDHHALVSCGADGVVRSLAVNLDAFN